ncbi:hypothetical protein B0H13DRAFT_2653361 [Mycena leptocephala]|nr:hypothetical protein B0H13DRAFT_2653361 [Mycena leptocephala]
MHRDATRAPLSSATLLPQLRPQHDQNFHVLELPLLSAPLPASQPSTPSRTIRLTPCYDGELPANSDLHPLHHLTRRRCSRRHPFALPVLASAASTPPPQTLNITFSQYSGAGPVLSNLQHNPHGIYIFAYFRCAGEILHARPRPHLKPDKHYARRWLSTVYSTTIQNTRLRPRCSPSALPAPDVPRSSRAHFSLRSTVSSTTPPRPSSNSGTLCTADSRCVRAGVFPPLAPVLVLRATVFRLLSPPRIITTFDRPCSTTCSPLRLFHRARTPTPPPSPTIIANTPNPVDFPATKR